MSLIGVLGRAESLEHIDPPGSCPCAQPVMSKASSRALWLSLWALSTPNTSLPRAVVSPQGVSHPCPQSPTLFSLPTYQDFGCVPALLRVSFSKGPDPTPQGLLYGSPGPLPMVFPSNLCHIRVFGGGIHVDSKVVTQRRGKIDWSGRASRKIKVAKLPCKLQSAIQWKLLLL